MERWSKARDRPCGSSPPTACVRRSFPLMARLHARAAALDPRRAVARDGDRGCRPLRLGRDPARPPEHALRLAPRPADRVLVRRRLVHSPGVVAARLIAVVCYAALIPLYYRRAVQHRHARQPQPADLAPRAAGPGPGLPAAAAAARARAADVDARRPRRRLPRRHTSHDHLPVAPAGDPLGLRVSASCCRSPCPSPRARCGGRPAPSCFVLVLALVYVVSTSCVALRGGSPWYSRRACDDRITATGRAASCFFPAYAVMNASSTCRSPSSGAPHSRPRCWSTAASPDRPRTDRRGRFASRRRSRRVTPRGCYLADWRRTISVIQIGANGDVQPGGVG